MADVISWRPRLLATPIRRGAAGDYAKRTVSGARALHRTMSRDRRHARTLGFRTDPCRRGPSCIDRSLFCERINQRTFVS